MAGQSPIEPPTLSFAWLLRQLRAESRLTQEELAQKAGLSPRSISDLERGISRTARKDTAGLLADALAIGGSVRTAFVAAARGRAPVSDVLRAQEHTHTSAPAAQTRWYDDIDTSLSPHEIELFEKLIEAVTAVATSVGSAMAGICLVGLTPRAESQITPNHRIQAFWLTPRYTAATPRIRSGR